MIVFLAAICAACGGSKSGTSVETRRSQSGPKLADRFAGPFAGGKRGPGESACIRARVLSSGKPGEITISVHCAGAPTGGSAGFVVQRYRPSNRRQTVVVSRNPPHLRVSDRSALAGPASCSSKRRELDCRAVLKARTDLEVRLSVAPQHRCIDGVSVVGVEPQSCQRGNCGGSVYLRQLFLGRPHGC